MEGIGRTRGRTYEEIRQRERPMNHIRIVIAGISGSSMLETDARTSGNGLSSSSSPNVSKSKPILQVRASQHRAPRRKKIRREGEGDAENAAAREVGAYFIDSDRLSVSAMLGVLSSPDIE